MADVVKKIITANVIKNGYRLVNVDKLGNKQTLAPSKLLKIPDVTSIESSLTNKFDDINYYS